MARFANYLASAAILTLALAGGLWTVWGSAGPQPTVPLYRLPSQLLEKPFDRLPLMRWYSEERIERVGTALFLPDKNIGFSFYEDAPMLTEEQALLLESGPHALWALRNKQMEARLQRSAQAFFNNAEVTLNRILSSAAFQEDYAPAFRAIVTSSVEAASQAPESQAAAQLALQAYRDLLVEEVVAPGTPILMEEVRSALKENFQAGPGRFLGQLLGGNVDPEVFAVALDRTLEDPAITAQVEAALKQALVAKETEQLAITFSRALLTEMAGRQETIDLLRRLLIDPRFSDSLMELRMLSLVELRDMSELLLGLGITQGVHPLAALVIRAFLQLDPPYFVLLAPAHVAARLSAGDLPAGHLLYAVDSP